jgi:hypothetical protein
MPWVHSVYITLLCFSYSGSALHTNTLFLSHDVFLSIVGEVAVYRALDMRGVYESNYILS